MIVLFLYADGDRKHLNVDRLDPTIVVFDPMKEIDVFGKDEVEAPDPDLDLKKCRKCFRLYRNQDDSIEYREIVRRQ